MFERDLADGFAGVEGFVGDGGGFVVADGGDEGGAHGEGAFDEFGGAVVVGFEAFEEVVGEHGGAVGEDVDGLEEALGDEGHGDVEVEDGAYPPHV